MTIEQSEQLQNDIITHCDGLPVELITRLCQVVVEFQKELGENYDHATNTK